jgi:hypothetical protein
MNLNVFFDDSVNFKKYGECLVFADFFVNYLLKIYLILSAQECN